jgi:general stress protein YciG
MTSKGARGFGSMDPDQQRAIARKGGESVPPQQRSFSKNRELAAQAGRKGGEARGANARNAHREHSQTMDPQDL